jgi:outer membrane receptor protein involved in Fe transport
MVAGGYITNSALKGTAFGPGGASYTFPVGSFTGGAYEFGGSVPGNYPQEGVALKSPNDRVTAYSHIEYDVNEALKVHATFNLADISAKTYSTAFMNTYTIRSGNPYIPAAIQSRMTASNIASFNLAYLYSDLDGGRIQQSVDQVTARASFGFRWDLGNKWEADGHAAYGDNTVKQKYPGLLNTRSATQAANAVLVNGQIQCADTSNGCVPLNVFGSGSASPGALAFIRSDAWTNVKYVQETAAVNLRGEPFSTWAGPVSFATGLEYRRETQTDESDALQASGVLQGLNQQSFDGNMNVRELYLESVLPLAKGLPFVKSFDVNLGARGTRYSLIGQANTWKAGATWNVTDELLLRATRSRDIRAPNLTELFFPLTRTNSNVQIVGQTQLANFSTGGNSNLKPEVADGMVAGLTYRPKALAGLDLSLDVYKMDIANVISSASSSQILSACAAGYAPSCAQIKTVNGIVTDVQGGFSNISSLQLKGIDAEVSYTRPLTGVGLPGSLQVRALGTYTDKLVYQAFPGVAAENFAGQTSAGLSVRTPFFAPRMKGTFSVGYRDRSLSTSLVANYISKSKVQRSLTTAQYANNDVPTYVTLDLQGSYNFGEKDRCQLYATVKNLADKSPPYTPNVLLFIPTNPAIYDVVGRTFKVGLRYSY